MQMPLVSDLHLLFTSLSRYFCLLIIYGYQIYMSSVDTVSLHPSDSETDSKSNTPLSRFQRLSRLLTNYSSYTLSSSDIASVSLQNELSELGQFAEVASSRGSVPVRFLFNNISKLIQTDFPLEGYDALPGCTLISEYYGSTAHLHGYTAYRPASSNRPSQLIVAFSGTTNLTQVLFDLRFHMHTLSSGHGSVHDGFWRIYKGIREHALDGLSDGLRQYPDAEEFVVTGHSMGGSLSILFLLDAIFPREHREERIPRHMKLKLAVFGAPRVGDAKLRENWKSFVDEFREERGESAFAEYSVKAYNDVIPSLPPFKLGYRHPVLQPLFLSNAKLYHVPQEYSEDWLFMVDSDDSETDPKFIRPTSSLIGSGHNFYNGRDMEKCARRIHWLDKFITGTEDWEARYRRHFIGDTP